MEKILSFMDGKDAVSESMVVAGDGRRNGRTNGGWLECRKPLVVLRPGSNARMLLKFPTLGLQAKVRNTEDGGGV